MACVLARGGDGGSSVPAMCANLTNSRSGTAGCASSWSLADFGAIGPRVPNRFGCVQNVVGFPRFLAQSSVLKLNRLRLKYAVRIDGILPGR